MLEWWVGNKGRLKGTPTCGHPYDDIHNQQKCGKEIEDHPALPVCYPRLVGQAKKGKIPQGLKTTPPCGHPYDEIHN